MNKLHLTYHKDNKLEGIISLNTSSLCNAFCNAIGGREKRRKEREGDMICHYCYSEKNEVVFKNLENKLLANSEILSKPLENIPFINASFVRFHSFGELINQEHADNFYKIAKSNPNTTFCLMTKRYDLVMKNPKLDNVVYVSSSPKINETIVDENVLKYFDKTFTVFTTDFVEKNPDVKINCHGKSCVECRLCYTRQGEKAVGEILRK